MCAGHRGPKRACEADPGLFLDQGYDRGPLKSLRGRLFLDQGYDPFDYFKGTVPAYAKHLELKNAENIPLVPFGLGEGSGPYGLCEFATRVHETAAFDPAGYVQLRKSVIPAPTASSMSSPLKMCMSCQMISNEIYEPTDKTNAATEQYMRGGIAAWQAGMSKTIKGGQAARLIGDGEYATKTG